MKNNKKIISVYGLLVSVLVSTTIGIYAYFTDSETVENTFTSGDISIELTEPNWNANNAKNILPLQSILKDPTIKNISEQNDAYVFVEVTVPYENVITAQADGTRNAAADTELFYYTINDGWVEIGTGTKDPTNKTVTHVYAYGNSNLLSNLEKNTSTPSLFDSVTFANIVEGQNIEGTTLNIQVIAKAIQTSNVNGNSTSPADVYAVLKNQMNE